MGFMLSHDHAFKLIQPNKIIHKNATPISAARDVVLHLKSTPKFDSS